MEALKFNYREKGYLYPVLKISKNMANDKELIGKYAMMWLNFMHEFHPDRYTELLMDGELLHMAHKINEESHEQIQLMMRNSSDIMRYEIAEHQIIREFVLVAR